MPLRNVSAPPKSNSTSPTSKRPTKKRDTERRHEAQTELFNNDKFTLDVIQPAADGTLTARGKFTFHGVTKEIAFPVTLAFQDSAICKFDGTLPLDTRDYVLPIIRNFGLLKVNPVRQIKSHLEGRLPAGT